MFSSFHGEDSIRQKQEHQYIEIRYIDDTDIDKDLKGQCSEKSFLRDQEHPKMNRGPRRGECCVAGGAPAQAER